MTQFTVNPTRLDPYKNFKFRLKWDGQYVSGVSKVSGLKRSTEVVAHREGGDPTTSLKSPGRTKYEPITLERGVSDDPTFENWANLVWNSGSVQGAEAAQNEIHKDITIELLNEVGQLVAVYHVYRCWPSEYQALPSLDSEGNAVAIEHLKLENEGWERDTSVVPPVQI